MYNPCEVPFLSRMRFLYGVGFYNMSYQPEDTQLIDATQDHIRYSPADRELQDRIGNAPRKRAHALMRHLIGNNAY